MNISLKIDQSLVDKTLGKINFNPLVVVDIIDNSNLPQKNYISTYSKKFSKVDNDELATDMKKQFSQYADETIKLLEDDFVLNNSKETPTQPNFVTKNNYRLFKESNYSDSLKSNNKNFDKETELQHKEDALSLGIEIVVQYVSQHSEKFEVETVEEAKKIIQTKNYKIYKRKVFGFGKFLGKVWKKIKNAGKKIIKWFKKIVNSIIGIGKPVIGRLRIIQEGKLNISLRKSVNVTGINLLIDKLIIYIPYYIKWPLSEPTWRSIRISVNRKIGADAKAKLELVQQAKKLYMKPTITKLKLKVKILGRIFKIGLTAMSNKLIKKNKLPVIDISKLALPINFLNNKLEYKIGSSTLIENYTTGIVISLDLDVLEK